ncbi:hypothetical protein V6046_22910, partial [Klebsiella pneumoniae]
IKVTVTIDGNSKVYTFESNGVASNESGSGISAFALHGVNIGADTNTHVIQVRVSHAQINNRGRVYGPTIVTAHRTNSAAFWE